MLLVGVESKAGKISRRLVALAGVVSSLSTKVSPRLRCYHSGVGFKSNPVKALWKLIEGLENQAASGPVSINTDAAKSFTEKLAIAAALGEENLLADVLGDVIEGESTDELKTFLAHADESDDPEVKQTLAAFVTAMLTALEALAKSQNMFSDVLRDYVQGSKESESRITGGQQTRDFWSDPDNAPDNIAYMVMMKLGLGMLSQCSHRVYGPLCSEAAKRASTHLEAWFEIHTLDDALVRFRKLVSLYREDAWLKPSGVDRPRDGEPGHIIQVFIDKAASSERLTQLICAVVVDSISEIGQGAVAIQ